MNPRRDSMKSGIRTAMILVTLLARAGVSLAQHEGHSMGGAPTGEGACLAHAKESLRIVDNANRRLEEARQVNSPPKMRAAVSELQAALGEIRTQLSLCVEPAAGGSGAPGMEGMDHSRMGQERPDALKSGKPPSGEMDHSKMGHEKPAVPKSEKPPSGEMDHSKMGHEKPAAPESAKPPSGEMDHSKMGKAKPAAPSATQAKKPVDPICFKEPGSQATEKATYQEKTYYFCSRADREKFLSDPEKYVNR